MIPGQGLVQITRPEIDARVDAHLLEGLHPEREVEAFRPPVEARPHPPRGLERVRRARVAAREDPFQERRVGIPPLETHVVHSAETLTQALDLLVQGLHRVLQLPLERRVRLGHVGGDSHVEAHPLVPALRPLLAFPDDLRNAVHVRFGLGRQTDHEVELDPAPSLVARELDGIFQLRLVDPLVDHVAHPLRPRLRREGDAAAAPLLDLIRDRGRERSDPGGRQRHVDAELVREAVQLVEHHRKLLVVGGGEGEQGNLVPARVRDAALDFIHDLIRALFPERTVHVAGEAEATAAGAAAHDLHAEPVVRDLGRRDERLLRVVLRIERRHVAIPRLLGRRVGLGLARDETEGVHHLVEVRRHVHALERAQAAKHFRALEPLLAPLDHEVAHLLDDLFAVSDHERVHEGRERLRIHRAQPARHQNRVVVAAVRGAERNLRQVDHREHVGI